MLLKSGLSALFLVTATAAMAQSEAVAPEPAEDSAPSAQEVAVGQTASAFGQCIATAMQGLAASVAPEAGAASVLGGCSAQKDQLVEAVEALIATLPEAERAASQEQFRSQMAQAEAQIAEGIVQLRTAAAAVPPTPAQ